MKLEIAPTFHYETVLRLALDPPLPLQQRPALRPPPLRYLSLAAAAHRACRQVTRDFFNNGKPSSDNRSALKKVHLVHA